MGTGDSKDSDTTSETTNTKESQVDQESNVVNLFDHRLNRLSDQELVDECLLSLRFIEAGLLTPERKIIATQLFNQAITRPALEYIRDDFRVTLRVLKHL